MQDKISIRDAAALPYLEKVSQSLREQMIELLHELPEEMKISGKAVNGELKGVFREGDFAFAMYVERDHQRPMRKFLGVSTLSSFLPYTCGTYLANNTTAGLINFIENEYSKEDCAMNLQSFMQSLYEDKPLDD